jgi:hypothetical protein
LIEQSKINIERSLSFQQHICSILDGLNVAVIELDSGTDSISYSNEAGFKLMQSFFRSKHSNEPLPNLLKKNRFLQTHLTTQFTDKSLSSERDLAIERELISMPVYKLHKVEKDGRLEDLNMHDNPQIDYSLNDFTLHENIEKTIFSVDVKGSEVNDSAGSDRRDGLEKKYIRVQRRKNNKSFAGDNPGG